MADELIPLDQLTDAEVEFMIQQKAENEAWDLHPIDPIYRENDIKKRRERIMADLTILVEEIKQGKRDMPGVHPSNCGRDPSVRLRPHDHYAWNLKKAELEGRNLKFPYSRAQLSRLGFLTDPSIKLLSLNPDSPKNNIIDPFHLRLWFLVSHHADAIRPILRLASRLLMSPPSVKYLHALMFNERTPEKTARKIWLEDFPEIQYSHHQDKPTVELTSEVMKVLKELSKNLNWRLFDRHDPYLKRSERDLFESSDAFATRRKTLIGTDIYVDKVILNYLKKCMLQSARTPELICSAVRVRFYLANVLCHELCHAINSWVDPSAYNEPFFKDYSMTECGDACKFLLVSLTWETLLTNCRGARSFWWQTMPFILGR